MVRGWLKPLPEDIFSLRVPIEYASMNASVSQYLTQGRFAWLTRIAYGDWSIYLCMSIGCPQCCLSHLTPFGT